MPAHAAVVGHVVRTGKRAPKKDKRTPKLAKYLLDPKTGKKVTAAKLPPLPTNVKNSKYGPRDWGMMGNAEFGNCTIAGGGHGVQVTSGGASHGASVITPTDDEILAAYWATGSPPTPGADDKGRYELDVLNYWRHVGIGGHKALMFASIDNSLGHKLFRYAIHLFGFAYIGLALPESAQTQKVWQVTRGQAAKPGTWGGHAVIAVDFDKTSVTCITWGKPVKMTWGFFARYCDEKYAVILPEWLDAAGASPAGFNVEALTADLRALGVSI